MENMEKKDAGMPAGKKKRKIPWSMLYILATVVAVLLFGLFNQQFGNVFHTISNLTPGFLSLGVLISLVYFLFEGEIFRLLLRSQGYRISVVEGLKNALLGLYYSYITPSSTGGQPMQSAYLLRDNKIPAGISTAVLIVKFMCFQCAFVLVSVVSFIGMYGNLAANNPTIIPFIVLGLVINGCSILFFASLFYKPVLHLICRLAKWLVRKIKFLRKRAGLLESIDRFEADFSSYTDDFKGKQKSLIAGVLLSIPQFILQMSVIYFIFRAFGYHNVGYLEIVAVQSLAAGVRVLHAHARGLWRPGDWFLLLLPQLLCQRRPLRRGDGLAVLHLLPGGHRRGHPGGGGPGLVPQEKAERGPFHQRTS